MRAAFDRQPITTRNIARGIPLLIVALLAACAAPADQADPPAAIVSAPVIRAERAALARTISLAANVEAYERAPLYAKVPGYVATITVDIGDAVGEGQLLATLEMPEIAQQYAQAESHRAEARAALASARAEAGLQRSLLKRSVGLREKDAISEEDLEQARAGAAKARAEVALADARTATAEARLKELEANLGYGELRAPFAGIVTQRFVDRGALVQAATSRSDVRPVVVVARVDQLRISVDVPEPDVPLVDVGDPAVLTIAALPDRTFAGTIARVAGALEPGSRTMRAEVDLPNADGALRSGMYGTLTIDVETVPDALTLPAAAVKQGRKGASVFVLDGSMARLRAVTPGLTDGDRVQILAGISSDDDVVATTAGIADGTPIQRAAAQDPTP